MEYLSILMIAMTNLGNLLWVDNYRISKCHFLLFCWLLEYLILFFFSIFLLTDFVYCRFWHYHCHIDLFFRVSICRFM